MKKMIAFLLLGALLFSLLTGCMGSDTSDITSENMVENTSENTVENTPDITASSDTSETTDGDKNEYTEGIMYLKVMDMDQNVVNMSDLISENKVTMLNFWGTFCGPCLQEMPYLGELERKYKDSGFEILGLTVDILDYEGNVLSDVLNDALQIKKDTGITYPVFIASPEIINYENVYAYPTTVFVNSNGKALTNPIIGMQTEEQWEEYILYVLELAEKE